MKYDYWRYLILYNEGGCYVDADGGPKNPFDQFVRGRLSLGIENNHLALVQWSLCSAKQQPFIKELISIINDKIVFRKYDKGYKHIVHTTTGPTLVTDTFRAYYGMTGDLEHWLSHELLRHEDVYYR
eukprot:UN12237